MSHFLFCYSYIHSRLWPISFQENYSLSYFFKIWKQETTLIQRALLMLTRCTSLFLLQLFILFLGIQWWIRVLSNCTEYISFTCLSIFFTVHHQCLCQQSYKHIAFNKNSFFSTRLFQILIYLWMQMVNLDRSVSWENIFNSFMTCDLEYLYIIKGETKWTSAT